MTHDELDVFWGLVVPGVIFLSSFLLTFWLYHHFSGESGEPRE